MIYYNNKLFKYTVWFHKKKKKKESFQNYQMSERMKNGIDIYYMCI